MKHQRYKQVHPNPYAYLEQLKSLPCRMVKNSATNSPSMMVPPVTSNAPQSRNQLNASKIMPA